jgi:serine/threonine protein kinase
VGLIGVSFNPYYLLMEYIEGGSLYNLIQQQSNPDPKIRIDSWIIWLIATDTCKGMAHIHREGLLHCDLAARNLLVVIGGERKISIKISDFGLSHRMSEQQNYDLQGGEAVPLRWSAPELVSQRKVLPASDVWSFGLEKEEKKKKNKRISFFADSFLATGVVLWECFELSRPYPTLLSNKAVADFVLGGGRLGRPTAIPCGKIPPPHSILVFVFCSHTHPHTIFCIEHR